MATQSTADTKAEREAERRQAQREPTTAAEAFRREAQGTTDTAVEAGERIARAGAGSVGRAADTAQSASQMIADTAERIFTTTSDQLNKLFSIATPEAREGVEQGSQRLQAVLESQAALTEASQEILREWSDFAREAAQEGANKMTDLFRARTLPELFAVQSDLMHNNLTLFLQRYRRIGELTIEASERAEQTMHKSLREQNRKNRQTAAAHR